MKIRLLIIKIVFLILLNNFIAARGSGGGKGGNKSGKGGQKSIVNPYSTIGEKNTYEGIIFQIRVEKRQTEKPSNKKTPDSITNNYSNNILIGILKTEKGTYFVNFGYEKFLREKNFIPLLKERIKIEGIEYLIRNTPTVFASKIFKGKRELVINNNFLRNN